MKSRTKSILSTATAALLGISSTYADDPFDPTLESPAAIRDLSILEAGAGRGSILYAASTGFGGAVGSGGGAALSNEAKEQVTYLGIAADAVSEELAAHLPLDAGVGLVVRSIGADSPAAKAGVGVNDVVTKIDDQLLVHPRQLQVLVRAKKDGDSISITYLRKGELKTVTAKLEKRELPVASAGFGGSWNYNAERINQLVERSMPGMSGSGGGGLPLFQKQTVFIGPDGKVTRMGGDIDVDRIRRDVEKELQKAGMAEDVRKQVSEALKKAESSIKKAEAEAKKTAEDATRAAEDARRRQ